MNGLNLAMESGLKICKCAIVSDTVTCEISLNDVEKLIEDKFKKSNAIFVAWQIQNIIWGKYDDKKLSSTAEITPQYWQECRIFNAAEEIHLKRVENKLRGRYIQDSEGAGNFYADSFSRFWGEKSGAADGFIKLLDRQRKIYMEIPCAETDAKWYGLLTRNYISSEEKTGLSGYTDYRFVAIESAKAGVKIG